MDEREIGNDHRAVTLQKEYPFEGKFLQLIQEMLLECDIVRYFFKFGVCKEREYDLSEEMSFCIKDQIVNAKNILNISSFDIATSRICERIYEQIQKRIEQFALLGVKNLPSIRI